MYKAVLKIYHKGCWGSEISLRFPKLKFLSIDVRWIKNEVAHIVRATGAKHQFHEIYAYLKSRRDIQSVEILSQTIDEIYIRTLTKNNPKYPSFSNLFFNNHCFPASPVRFDKKYEIWTLGAAGKENLAKVYGLLKKKYLVHIIYLKEDEINAKLTEKQRQAFLYARYFGYYSWPRKKTASDIAEILKISKTVFFSHLRKAEIKIMNLYLQ